MIAIGLREPDFYHAPLVFSKVFSLAAAN